MSYQVLLVGEHRIIRDGIKALIERNGEFKVVAEAENGSDAVRISRGVNSCRAAVRTPTFMNLGSKGVITRAS